MTSLKEEIKATKKSPLKGKKRPLYIGLKIEGHPDVKKEDVKQVFVTRDTRQVIENIQRDASIVMIEAETDN